MWIFIDTGSALHQVEIQNHKSKKRSIASNFYAFRYIYIYIYLLFFFLDDGGPAVSGASAG